MREITLLGQNVNSWGRDLAPDIRTEFGELLRACDAVDGIERIRFTSPHPKDFREPVVAAMAECDAVCEHIHLPLQSGSTRILKAMRRTYSRERYLKLAERLRDAIPDLALGTDIIVGFPGETEADFEETLAVVEEVRYDSAFTFIYSPRRGTDAATMADQVPEAGQARAARAARRGRAAHRGGAQRRARRAGRAGARRGAEPNGRDAAPRPHAPQHDRGLHGLGAGRRPRRRGDRGIDLDDAARLRRHRRSRLTAAAMVAVIAVFGPTASGKTAVAEEVADRLGSEVVSCDAMQVYRGLPILTNQPSRPTALVGIRELSEEMSVGAYATLAHAAIDELVARTGIAVVSGGTGLYLRAALADLDVPPPPGCGRAGARSWPRSRAIRPRRTRGSPASIRGQPRPSTRTTSGASSARSSSRKRASRSYPTTTASGRARPGTRP